MMAIPCTIQVDGNSGGDNWSKPSGSRLRRVKFLYRSYHQNTSGLNGAGLSALRWPLKNSGLGSTYVAKHRSRNSAMSVPLIGNQAGGNACVLNS